MNNATHGIVETGQLRRRVGTALSVAGSMLLGGTVPYEFERLCPNAIVAPGDQYIALPLLVVGLALFAGGIYLSVKYRVRYPKTATTRVAHRIGRGWSFARA